MQCHVCGDDVEATGKEEAAAMVDHFEDVHGLGE